MEAVYEGNYGRGDCISRGGCVNDHSSKSITDGEIYPPASSSLRGQNFELSTLTQLADAFHPAANDAIMENSSADT